MDSLFALQELHAGLDQEWPSSQFHCEKPKKKIILSNTSMKHNKPTPGAQFRMTITDIIDRNN